MDESDLLANTTSDASVTSATGGSSWFSDLSQMLLQPYLSYSLASQAQQNTALAQQTAANANRSLLSGFTGGTNSNNTMQIALLIGGVVLAAIVIKKVL
ncbi:MAG TPA: hypothetical protein VMH83_06265 [Candidatus Acidoferrum sp.]|nr:hypothetical protein [Candidatus Acidoferrum sp.]